MNWPLLTLFPIILIALTMSGCTTKVISKNADTSQFKLATPPTQTKLLSAQAETDEHKKALTYLEACEEFLSEALLSQARFAYRQIDQTKLSLNDLVRYQLSGIQLGAEDGDINLLAQSIKTLDLDLALRTNISEQQQRVRLIASALSTLERPIQAAVLLSDYEGVFGLSESAALNEEIWLLLQRSKTDALTAYSYQGSNENTLAWLKLAKDVKLRKASIDDQHKVLLEWVNRHPNHPATSALPLELDLLAHLNDTAPTHIVLALPLSGPLANIGQAIRDGFLAAYYRESSSERRLNIHTFDTEQTPLSELYQTLEAQIELDDNTLVVGPITKERIENLSNQGRISIPTLALNNSRNISHQNDLFLFGLDPKHELRQLAQEMTSQGYTRVGVISAESQRSDELLSFFKTALEAAGGQVVNASAFPSNQALADTVAELLGTNDSATRLQAVRKATHLKLDSEPRRRKDIEALLILADNEQAKQIKPLFAFNFAKDIPVYANSSVHLADDTHSSDLNGIQFLDIPWMFTKTSPLHTSIDKAFGNDNNRYARFYALGADAYLLAPRLSLLREIGNSYVDGLTGRLSIQSDGEIQRELQWAKYTRGRVKPIN